MQKLYSFETLRSIKQRNAPYFWMSKYLRELVELFGQCSYGDTFEKDDFFNGKPLDALRGPFFCGMNFKMNIDAFAIRLNSPLSTSKVFEVAIKFSGPEGVTFTFDNPRTDRKCCYLRGFPCSHISRFMEEDEVLFFGGFYRAKVGGLRLIKTKENMKTFMAALFKLDQFLTSSFAEMTEDECSIINGLINLALNKQQTKVINLTLNKEQSKRTLPQYILNCFESFRNNKKSLIFDLPCFNQYCDPKIKGFFFYSLDACKNTDIKRDNLPELSNVLRPEVLSLFPNIQSLTIQNKDLKHSYPISMTSLLRVLEKANLMDATIKSVTDTNTDYCWITHSEISPKEMKQMYAAKGYGISLQEVIRDYIEYWFVITKKV